MNPTADESRPRFIRSLHGMNTNMQLHLLSVESDEEIKLLKEYALSVEYFEVAWLCAFEMRRRAKEKAADLSVLELETVIAKIVKSVEWWEDDEYIACTEHGPTGPTLSCEEADLLRTVITRHQPKPKAQG